MTSELGIVVSLSRWRATVHYVDCTYYGQGAGHHHLPLPRRIKVHLCSVCRPSEADVRTGTPEVSWYEYGPAPLAGVKVRQKDFDDQAERVAGRRALGWGRTPARREGWT